MLTWHVWAVLFASSLPSPVVFQHGASVQNIHGKKRFEAYDVRNAFVQAIWTKRRCESWTYQRGATSRWLFVLARTTKKFKVMFRWALQWRYRFVRNFKSFCLHWHFGHMHSISFPSECVAKRLWSNKKMHGMVVINLHIRCVVRTIPIVHVHFFIYDAHWLTSPLFRCICSKVFLELALAMRVIAKHDA